MEVPKKGRAKWDIHTDCMEINGNVRIMRYSKRLLAY